MGSDRRGWWRDCLHQRQTRSPRLDQQAQGFELHKRLVNPFHPKSHEDDEWWDRNVNRRAYFSSIVLPRAWSFSNLNSKHQWCESGISQSHFKSTYQLGGMWSACTFSTMITNFSASPWKSFKTAQALAKSSNAAGEMRPSITEKTQMQAHNIHSYKHHVNKFSDHHTTVAYYIL